MAKLDLQEVLDIRPLDLEPVDEKRPVEPGEVAGPPSRPEPFVKPETIQKYATRPVRKGLGVGLGALGWSFERASALVGGAAREISRQAKERNLRKMQGYRVSEPEETLNLIKGVTKASVPAVKSLVSKELHPEAVTIMDVVREDVMPNSPAWQQFAVGLAAEFAVTPAIVGRAFRLAAGGAKLTGVPQKIVAAGLPRWKRMKLRTRAKTGARIERAKEVTKTLTGREAKNIAKEMSERTGTKITSKAVEERLGQIMKGGITQQPSMQKAVTPAMKELAKVQDELKKLGILSEQTFITKLSKKQMAVLATRKAKLQARLKKLEVGKEVIPKFPGKRRVVKRLEERLAKLDTELNKFPTIAKPTRPEARGVESLSPTRTKEFVDLLKQKRELEYLGQSTKEVQDRLAGFIQPGTVHEAGHITGGTPDKISKLITQKRNAMKRLANITEPKIVKPRFPGRAKEIRKLKGQVDDVQGRMLQSTHQGATIARRPDGTLEISGGGDKYFPRMFAGKEAEQSARVFPVHSQHRVRAPYAKQRKGIPFDVRKKMGEVTRPAYPVTKRLIQEGADIETAKLFRQVAHNSKFASKTWRPGLARKAIPSDKGYHALKGMYVSPKIRDDVTLLVQGTSDIGKLYDTLVGAWKMGKVTLSPPTHFRNKFSNKILLDLSGMGYTEQAKYAARALQEWRLNTKEYQMAKRYFARTTLIKGELMDDILRTTSKKGRSVVEKMTNAMRSGIHSESFLGKTARKPAELYQHEEFVNKFMKYLQQRDKGKSVIQSVEEANKWLFDYGELSRFERTVMRRVMPFYTFPRKALPRVAEAMATRPHTVAKYPLLAQAMTEYSLNKLEITDKDFEDIKKTLPEYMDTGSYVLMPYRDENGDLRFFDWTYIVPWGEIAEVQNRGIAKSVVTNPLVTIIQDVFHNKSQFTGRKIWDDKVPEQQWTKGYRREQNFKKWQYVWQSLMPSLTPKIPIGPEGLRGMYWDKLEEAATGKTIVRGGKEKTRPLKETIAHTIFGLRTQAIDPEMQEVFKASTTGRAMQEVARKMADLQSRRDVGNISEEEYQKKYKIYEEQLDNLME